MKVLYIIIIGIVFNLGCSTKLEHGARSYYPNSSHGVNKKRILKSIDDEIVSVINLEKEFSSVNDNKFQKIRERVNVRGIQ